MKLGAKLEAQGFCVGRPLKVAFSLEARGRSVGKALDRRGGNACVSAVVAVYCRGKMAWRVRGEREERYWCECDLSTLTLTLYVATLRPIIPHLFFDLLLLS